MSRNDYPENLVFGLDIGTRSIVGTVGYLQGERFVVVAQQQKEHQTRSMIDGQIHDIVKVGATIKEVKSALEMQLGFTLKEVCIAAAGRVLRTVTKHVDYDLQEERIVTTEDVYTLESLGVQQAYEEFQEENDTDLKFYCVGYSVVKYYMNDFPTSNLVHHKAHQISLDIIATFLPDDVVEGLYAAVREADLEVINLTLEPIAAIRLAIPEKFRMLNIGLIDVGAGTSDISITKDGSIIAYGMIPCAGDSMTEILARHFLTDFATAEKIKTGIATQEEVQYKDVMGLDQSVKREEVLALLKDQITNMAQLAADELMRLNGGTSPSAVFIVGGGGKIAGYTDTLADMLGIPRARVALRGTEVMEDIEPCEGMEKDSLLVTPLGICLCYYEQSNNFMFVEFNGERIKLYDNRKLTIMDVVMQVHFPSEGLFPRRGKALQYFVNGKERITRGEPGEAASIICNGTAVDVNYAIHANDRIEIKESTVGEAAVMQIRKLPEYQADIKVNVNGKKMILPKFASVNGKLEPESYEIQAGDRIEMLDCYTLAQVATFLDINPDDYAFVTVNNLPANMETEVYENFTVQWMKNKPELYQNLYEQDKENDIEDFSEAQYPEKETKISYNQDTYEESKKIHNQDTYEESKTVHAQEKDQKVEQEEQETVQAEEVIRDITVIVNGIPVTMSGKANYMFVDVFDYIDFDTSKMKGNGIATLLNGSEAQYMEYLKAGDKIEIFWR